MKPNPKYPHLLSPLRVGNTTFKHRILSSPTSQAQLSPEGYLTAENIAYYRMRARGGAGLVTIGDCIVSLADGRSHPMQVAIDDEGSVPSLTACADAIHSEGALAGVQIDHGGELCEPDFLAPGTVPMGPTEGVDEYGDFVRAMTPEDMDRIADCYAEAAERAMRCGFDLVQIHCGHGWLLHQFLSPLSNRREDEYGGSLENRMRFPLMVIRRVRAAVGHKILLEARISGDELTPGGYDIETGVEIAKALDGQVDLIHVSAGTQKVVYSAVLMHPPIFSPDAPFAQFARRIKAEVRTPVVLVGALDDPDLMEQLIAEGYCDAVAMGRGLVADPFFPNKVVMGKEELITPCLRCLDCEGSLKDTRTLRCAVNPFAGRELQKLMERPAPCRRKVLVVGGGPAGMEAALTAAQRGHQVTLCEAKDHLGGALEFADDVPFKRKLRLLRESLERQMRAAGVEIRLNTKVDAALVETEEPDTLILALGGSPLRLPIPGMDENTVHFAADRAQMETVRGNRIVIAGGGLIGCETALHLDQEGKQVVLIEMQEEVAPDCNFMHRIALLHQLEESGVEIHTGLRCTAFGTDWVETVNETGETQRFDCDAVICAMGIRPRTEETDALRGLVANTLVIGDCTKAGRILHATRAGWEVATNGIL
jgi:2,4-dienoyl-CoA reductase-like NADH-dependent reductase (Old Yellow Enzyme family)/thioredoxin reductase